MGQIEGFNRMRTLQVIVLVIFAVIAGRLFFLQIIDSSRNKRRAEQALVREIQYPARGEVFDRNGEYLVRSRECYDIMVVYREMDKRGFDTVRLCNILNISKEKLVKELRQAKNAPRAARLVTNYVPKEDKLRFDEAGFKGFSAVYRTAREYPRQVGGNLLGYVGVVNEEDTTRDNFYVITDYIGRDGIESAYEEILRGEKGVKVYERDAHGAIKGSYRNGELDRPSVPGKALTTTIDIRLQKLCEELMVGKVGAAVAIDPSNGEILMMVSAPSFDPDLLVGRERGDNYMKLLNNYKKPLYNRAVKSPFPPGSTFKLVQGLIGLQEGVLKPSSTYGCHMGYSSGGMHVGCHSHSSPLNLRLAVAHSCNAYFCYVFRNILDNPKYESPKDGFDVWREYVLSFGFGRRLGTDLYGERHGNVPSRAFYDRLYRRSWNSLTPISLSIGQGELGCTPLQMANLAAIIANRGYYYIPHLVKSIEGEDGIDPRFTERHYTDIDPQYFDPIIEGMWTSVHKEGTSRGAELEGLDVCGKTGTAQNPHGEDHSTFLSFAPKDNPKIAISVYVENGGFGSTVALPIASLIEELYLTDTITRPDLVRRVKEIRPYYRRPKSK